LEQQRSEAMAKRRVGLGFTGLGDALIMLGLKYDSAEARQAAARISESMRDHAYRASVELARERGAFPLFNADLYLAGESFASRLPLSIKQSIQKHGVRNSHLLSIAPTGTISLAFADNASNGIEPPFSWVYTRKKRMPDGTMKEYTVEDHAWRRYRAVVGNADGGRGRALRRHQHLEDGQRARGLSLRRFPGPLFPRLEIGAQGAGDLPPQQGAGLGALGGEAAGLRAGRRQPPPHREIGAGAGAVVAALAGAARPRPGQPVVDLHDRAPAVPLRGVRRSRRGSKTTRVRSVGERQRAAARPGRGGEDAVDGHARRRPCLARDEARCAGEERRRRRLRPALPAEGRAKAHAFGGFGLRPDREVARRAAAQGSGERFFPHQRRRRLSRGGCDVRAEGAQDRHRRHHVLDRR